MLSQQAKNDTIFFKYKYYYLTTIHFFINKWPLTLDFFLDVAYFENKVWDLFLMV